MGLFLVLWLPVGPWGSGFPGLRGKKCEARRMQGTGWGGPCWVDAARLRSGADWTGNAAFTRSSARSRVQIVAVEFFLVALCWVQKPSQLSQAFRPVSLALRD